METYYSSAVEKEARLPTCDTYVAGRFLVRDCSLRKFAVTYSVPGSGRSGPGAALNRGAETALTVTIARDPGDNPITIRGGCLRFVMARASYRVEGGEIVQQVPCDDGAHTIVYVRTDVVHPRIAVTVRLSD